MNASRTLRFFFAAAVIVLVAGAYAACRMPAGRASLRTFDPDRVANLEVDMWQAYYKHENVRLFRGLVTLLHEQYRCSWAQATMSGFYLARAAKVFAVSRSQEAYDGVLVDLERGYSGIRKWTDSPFDPAAVARAEIAWWIARRIPGEDSPENVGRLLAGSNALLYSVPTDRVLNASILRARAGRLRDDGGEQADWPQVSQLLHESYSDLHRAVNTF